MGSETPMTDAVMKAAFQGDGAALVQRQAEALFHHARRLESALAVAERAMREFVDRRDRGEIRSVRSYAAFSEALRTIEQIKGGV